MFVYIPCRAACTVECLQKCWAEGTEEFCSAVVPSELRCPEPHSSFQGRLRAPEIPSRAVTDPLALHQLLQWLYLSAIDPFRLHVPIKSSCSYRLFRMKYLPFPWQSCPVHPQGRTTRSPMSARQRSASNLHPFCPHTCCRSS